MASTHSPASSVASTQVPATSTGCGSDSDWLHAMDENVMIGNLFFHQLALVLTAIFMCLSIGISGWLVLDHALHYLKPYEQKHILRILAVIPIYSIISFFSLLFYEKTVYLELIRTCYEAYVIASFFTLMCHYVAPNLHDQKEYFRNVQPKPWIFPLNKVKPSRSGLTWFNIVYACIFQFCITRPLLTIIAIITHHKKSYCPNSPRPEHGHLWIALLQGAVVLIAIYCLAQFYKQLKQDLAPHKPFLKILSIKLVMFLVFWQTWLINLVARKTPSKSPARTVGALDVHVAIPSMLICFEMTIFAGLLHWAFPWKPYHIRSQLRGPGYVEHYAGGPYQAVLDAMNPWDYCKAVARGCRWLFHDVHHRKHDPSYQNTLKKERESSDELELKSDTVKRARLSACSDPGPRGEIKKRSRKNTARGIGRNTVG